MNIMTYAKREVIALAPEDPIDRAISIMEERGFHHIVVFQDQRVVGMVSDRDILLSTGWMLAVERQAKPNNAASVIGPTRLYQIMSQPAECIASSATCHDAAIVFIERKIGALPIVDQGRLMGILTQTDLLRGLLDHYGKDGAVDRLLQSPTSSLMRSKVLTVKPRSAIFEVVTLFRHYRVRHVPVVVDDAIVGIISDRDVRRSIGWAHIRDQQAEAQARMIETPVFAMDIMQRHVLTVKARTPLRESLDQMLESRVHSLPVVEGDLLRGIVTQIDFLKAIARELLL